MIGTIWAIFVCCCGVVGVAWIIWIARDGDDDRHREDAARAFFDEHGHWPDETAEQAELERSRLTAVHAIVTEASPDGSV